MNETGSNPAPISPEDLVLYAIQALPGDEMAAVSAALRDNPQAQQDLARFQGDFALLLSPQISSPRRLAPLIASEFACAKTVKQPQT